MVRARLSPNKHGLGARVLPVCCGGVPGKLMRCFGCGCIADALYWAFVDTGSPNVTARSPAPSPDKQRLNMM